MFDFHELSPNTRDVGSLAFIFSQPPHYISPPSAAPPLTLLDAHEMADLIQRTMPPTDVAIAADIAAHMKTENMSGRDFLNLSPTDLRTLSKNNKQVFRELEKLQQIPQDAVTYVSTRSPSLASVIHNHWLPSGLNGSMAIGNALDCLHNDSGPFAMPGPQFLEESFSHEAFDFSDDEEVAPHLHSTVAIVNEISPLPAPSPSLPFQVVDPGVVVLQDDPSLLDGSIPPETLADPALEDEPLFASSTSSNLGDILGQGDSNSWEPGHMNGTTPRNDLTITAITFVPNTHACPATIPARDGAAHILNTENAILQPTQDKPIEPTMTFYAHEESIHGLDKSELVNPLDPQSAGGPERDIAPLQNGSVSAGPDLSAHYHSPPGTRRSSSPALSYVDEEHPDAATRPSEIPLDDNVPKFSTPADPNILLEHDRLPIISIHGSPTTEPPSSSSSDPLEGSQIENSLTLSLDHFQPLINSHTPIAEDKEALEPPQLPESEPVAILSTSPSGVVHNTLNPPPFSEFLYAPDLKPYNPINDTCFNVDEASKSQPYEIPQSSKTSKGVVDRAVNENDSDSPRHLNVSSENPHDSLTSNGKYEPIESCRSSPQPLSSSLTSFLEPTPDLSLTRPHSVDADIQSVAASTDGNFVVDVPSTLFPLAHPSNLPRLEVHHDLDSDTVPQSDLDGRSNVDMNIPATSSHDSAITLPFDPLPPIPVTPSNSPILEDLYQFITLYNSDVPGSLSSNSSDPKTSGSDVDITIQPDFCCPHLPHRDGMSNRDPWPFQRVQLGVLNVIPTFFALDRETINRVTSC